MLKVEKETIINFNEASDVASVYTCTASIMRKLDKLGYKRNKEWRLDGKLESVEYVIPKDRISFRRRRAQQEAEKTAHI